MNLVNGLYSGSTSLEYHTIGLINHGESPMPHHYFDDFTFLGPRYRSGKKLIESIYDASEATEAEHWNNAFHIDPTSHELVIDVIERISKRTDAPVGLFKFKIDYSLSQVSTHEDEFAEIRKWNALNKLSDEEIKLLKLEKDMVYLKLKYGGEDEDGNKTRKKYR